MTGLSPTNKRGLRRLLNQSCSEPTGHGVEVHLYPASLTRLGVNQDDAARPPVRGIPVLRSGFANCRRAAMQANDGHWQVCPLGDEVSELGHNGPNGPSTSEVGLQRLGELSAEGVPVLHQLGSDCGG